MTRASAHQISTFAQVAKDRSFTKAAQQLGVSQSSVTQQIKKLEQTIGSQLFIRRREGLELTAAGRDLDKVARRYVMLGDAIDAKIRNYQKLNTGYLKVVATTPRPVLPIIQRFKQHYPDILIDLSLHSRTVCRNIMKNREADIGVIIEPDFDDDFICSPCQTTQYCAIMAKTHFLSKRKQLSLSELTEEMIIMPEDNSFTQQLIDKKLAEYNLVFKRLMKVQTFPLVKEAILHGIGISFFLKDSVFPSTTLETISVKELHEMYIDHVVIPQERQDSQIIQEFMRFVVN